MSQRPGQPSAAIKLVVWDLDDTIWRGTLSEGPVTLRPGMAELLGDLVDRGVMVSISSRNDAAAARAELERLGLWDLFVFPRVSWQAKGGQVRDLVAAAQLRPANVLFVDDFHLNREEVRFAAPDIQVADPDAHDFPERMSAVVAAGRPDPDRRRLAHYRQLEARTAEAAAFDDNVAFLRSCDIRVTLSRAGPADAERISDLVGRANQLNYTKRRIGVAEVRRRIGDPDTAAWVVQVTDRFGDEGLVGVAILRAGRAEHLAFSCRILGMGVERAVHRWLGAPRVDVVEPVAASLDGADPDWLTITEGPPTRPGRRRPSAAAADAPDTLFVGGCDLESVIAFLPDRARIATHFNAGHRDNPRIMVHRDSIDFLLADLGGDERRYVLDTVPFVDDRVFRPPDWSAYRHIVYSPLIDYVQAKYAADRVPGFLLSYGDVEAPVLDDVRLDLLAERGLDADAVRRFVAAWTPASKAEATWESQLDALFGRFGGAETVTVLLGATETHDATDASRLPYHRRANDLVTRVAARHPKVRLVAVDRWLQDPTDFSAGIRHYSRRVYAELAAEIAPRIGRQARRADRDRHHRPAGARLGGARNLLRRASRRVRSGR